MHNRKTLFLIAGAGAMALLATSCQNQLGFRAVSISPIYGYVDGCTDVKISGHGFGDDVSATIGGNQVTDLTLPDAEANPLDVGFLFYATTPPGAALQTNEVVVSSGGETSIVNSGFYYIACPGEPYVEGISGTTFASGDSVVLQGCNLDGGSYKVFLTDGAETDPVEATVDLGSVCSTAIASFEAPDLADGTYMMTIVDGDGNQVWPALCGDTGMDTGCDDTPLPVTYGGAE